MQKKMYSILTTFLIMTLIFSLSAPAFALENSNDSTTVQEYEFDLEELNKELKKAQSQPIYTDKGIETIETTKSMVSQSSTGTYPTRRGVILVTSDKYKGIIPLGHAAIIWTSSTVVESLQEGVTTGRNDWNTSRETCYGVTPYDSTTDQDNEAASWCYNQIGKPYNYNYPDKWTRSKFYCSQLVYAAYKDLYNIDLDTSSFLSAVHPMELVNTDETYTIYTK